MKDKILSTLERLVHISGISGTNSENATAVEIYNILSEIPYFRINSRNIMLHNIEEDPYGRHFVTALLKGRYASKKTLILTGHYDVVGIEEFGSIKECAFDIKECTKRISELTLTKEAACDLESGDWIFGRGTADMKYGLALEIEIVRKLSEERDFTGNILFLAVPGEESNSEGMLSAADYLAALQKAGYDFAGLLLSECCLPQYPGDSDKKIYLGTCGKVMPFFFCCGKETHVCEPFSGFNPTLVMSEINKLMELNTDFCEKCSSNITPPPSCLKAMDLKELYSVQTPIYAVSYYNIITLEMEIDKVMEKLKDVASQAFNNVIKIVDERKEIFRHKNIYYDYTQSEIGKELTVFAFSDIYKLVIETYGNEFNNYLKVKVKEWMNHGLDNQTIGINIVKETYERYPNKRPMIIIGFLPPYYPDKRITSNNEKNRTFLKAIDEVLCFAEDKYKVKIKKEEYFMGICDLSYTGFNGRDFKRIEENLCAGANYVLPMKSLNELDIPSVVFGGFGKDFHKYTERLNLSYSMGVVPELYLKLIKDILK